MTEMTVVMRWDVNKYHFAYQAPFAWTYSGYGLRYEMK